MKKIFEFEWSDELGQAWMNVDNLQACLDNLCRPGLCKATAVTSETPAVEELENILDKEEDEYFEILPNGEIRSRGQTNNAKPITMREDLGGEYN